MKLLTLLGLVAIVALQDAGAKYDHDQQHKDNQSVHPSSGEHYKNDHVLVVPTEYGRVRGRAARTTFVARVMDKVLGWTERFKLDARQYPRAFEGIPFAAPPVGENRFKHPQAFNASWGGINKSTNESYGTIRDARTPSNDCPQPFPPFSQSEDCLYLNVYTPSSKRIKELGGRVAVLFWLYPGAYIAGGSYQYGFYDGSYLAQTRDVIVITSNYRLGPLGFLPAEESGHEHANAAIMDQVKALEWVKRNIAWFGGDPDNITLWGLSAGAYSILIHMTSPMTPPNLFHKVILQSPPIGHHVRSRENIHAVNVKFAEQFGCLDTIVGEDKKPRINIKCMQRLPWPVITASSAFFITYGTPGIKEITDEFKWWPYLDGKVVTGEPRELMLSGNYKNVPIIIGSTKDEAGFWSMLLGLPVVKQVIGSHADYTVKGYIARTARLFGKFSKEYSRLYPVMKTQDEIEEQTSHGGTDIVWRCPINRVMASVTNRGTRAYVYEFKQKSRNPWFGMCYNRTCHMADLLQTWKKDSNMFLDESRQRIATHIQDYWTNFAKTGDPNNSGASAKKQDKLPRWPEFNGKDRLHLSIDDEVTVTTNQRENYCQFWDKAGIDY
ncbi:Carboxylesterase [Syncephalis plumigaleata]|nr:Carboxylesterase [Syncephalis plumigaleata]